ncbi:hypothetical protein D3C72_1311190 [compost metagenome]
MTIHPDIGADFHALAHHAPHREAAVVAGGFDALDGNARRFHGGDHAAQPGCGQGLVPVRRARVGARHAGPGQRHRRRFKQADVGGCKRDRPQRIEPLAGVERAAWSARRSFEVGAGMRQRAQHAVGAQRAGGHRVGIDHHHQCRGASGGGKAIG